MWMLFSLSISDPITPQVVGEIEGSGYTAMEIVRTVVTIISILAVGYVGYNVFFGNSRDSIISFILTLIIASIVTAITYFFA